jgi:hypothetical protein
LVLGLRTGRGEEKMACETDGQRTHEGDDSPGEQLSRSSSRKSVRGSWHVEFVSRIVARSRGEGASSRLRKICMVRCSNRA